MSHTTVTLPRDPVDRLRLFAAANPGIVNLSVAENVLLFPEIKQLLDAEGDLRRADLFYAPAYGPRTLRAAVAGLLNATIGFGSEPIVESQISAASGTRCVLEAVARVTAANAQPLVLMPTPCWQGFSWIYEDRLGGRIVPVPLDPANGYHLTLDALRSVYEGQPRPPSALILTHPHNPLGVNYEPELLDEILSWVLSSTAMHLVSDEIYAHSQGSSAGPAFSSVLARPLARAGGRERVHVAWGLGKDFGLSGFRGGFLLSRSVPMHDEVRRSSAGFGPFDTAKAMLVARLLDGGRGHRLMKVYRVRLQQRFAQLSTQLRALRVPFFEATTAAQFFWLDLRAYLDRAPRAVADGHLRERELLVLPGCDDREQRLLEYIVREARVQLLPGQTLGSSEPGFFRLCFTCADADVVSQAIDHVAEALAKLLR